MNKKDTTRDHAVVIGSSIAGLMSAAALSPYYAKVTLVDSDSFSEAKSVRHATPQGHHVHGLLSSGWKALKQLLPGVEERLQREGAEWVHFGKEFRWHHFGKFKAGFDALMEGPFMSRSCLESVVRSEVMAKGNVCFHSGQVVACTTKGSYIDGVRMASGEVLGAALVVDASGRSSFSSKWLEQESGWEAPRVGALRAGLRYSSCRFKVPHGHAEEWKALFVIPRPPESKCGAVFPQEDGNWLVTLGGREQDTMPRDHSEFLEFASQLSCPDVFQAINEAEPISSLAHYRFKESRRNFFEEIALPDNLLVIGDAVCSFNPIFGQGMTVCMLEALTMTELLGRGQCNSRHYFKAIEGVVSQAWEMITVEDMRRPELHSMRTLKIKLMQKLTQRVYDKTAENGELNKMLYEVIHFQRPATDLCKPWVLWKLL